MPSMKLLKYFHHGKMILLLFETANVANDQCVFSNSKLFPFGYSRQLTELKLLGVYGIVL